MSDSEISSSDEEFLTVVDDKQGSLDREALVRKKLLESFYGKSAVAAAAPTSPMVNSDDDDEDDDDIKMSPVTGGASEDDNLDSPSFDAAAHTQRHVVEASVHTLLEKEEQLALQVRTLDSTMQTLVYENYTRFIDCTDAIRSIGVNVQANESGLARLTAGMEAIDSKSKHVEDALGSLRDQVAEKIRVKRLLTRLDALLKLPQTLREQIDAGKYRTATKSYLQAASILGKHSDGFESLKNIETECTTILSEMKKELVRKVEHWSGHVATLEEEEDNADEVAVVPDPPKSMAEIFECVGTLLILLQNGVSMGAGMCVESLQSMASAAALRLLDRALDAHLMDIQERRFSQLDNSSSALDLKMGGVPEPEAEPVGSALIAQGFLNAMLEGATLFAMTFDAGEAKTSELMELVSEAFSSFLVHTKAILMEESAQVCKEDAGGPNESTDEVESGYVEISGALALLVQSVCELASGLALPEVGVSPDYSQKLVEQAAEVTESLIRRRVDQKFHALRLSVVQDCLIPFATQAAAEKGSQDDGEKDILLAVIQNVSSTLSNCLQFVDDTIRSILAGEVEGDQGSSAEVPDLKDAVEASTKRFAFWLANTFELLAGGDSSDRSRIAEASPDVLEGREDESNSLEGLTVNASFPVDHDDGSDMPGQDESLLEKVDSAVALLATNSEGSVHTDVVLSIAEMCRMAQGSVSVNLAQSIATHAGGGKKKSHGLFPSGGSPSTLKNTSGEDDITARFQLAESRILVLYASCRGSDAANLLCLNLTLLSETPDEALLDRPSDLALKALAIAKVASIEFASVYGGSKRAGPVPEMDDDRLQVPGMTPSLMSRKTGLQLDVERMFKEKVPIYPHPSETVEASRNAVLFLLFKIAFRAMFEQTRLLRFSEMAYRQLLVDKAFLKHILSHYIEEDFHPGGTSALTALTNLLGDFMDAVGDRCLDREVVEKDEYVSDAVERVHSFLTSGGELHQSFVIEEDSPKE